MPSRGPSPEQRVVLFDFDGVLVRGDMFHIFIRRRLQRGGWRWLPLLAMVPALAVLACWRNGRLAAGRLLARCAFLGEDEARYQRLVDRFAVGMVRASRRFPRTALRALHERIASGARVLIVSGCEERLLRRILAELAVGQVEVVATQLGRGVFGMRVVRHNIGAAKVRRLAELGIVPQWDVAFSDAWADLPLLRGAREAVLVNATPKLCKRVERALGRSVTRVEWH